MSVVKSSQKNARAQPSQIDVIGGLRCFVEVVYVVDDIASNRAKRSEVLCMQISDYRTADVRQRPVLRPGVQVAGEKMECCSKEGEWGGRQCLELSIELLSGKVFVKRKNL